MTRAAPRIEDADRPPVQAPLPRPEEEAGGAPVLACEDNLAFMARLPDERMKLIITSPPYNLGKA